MKAFNLNGIILPFDGSVNDMSDGLSRRLNIYSVYTLQRNHLHAPNRQFILLVRASNWDSSLSATFIWKQNKTAEFVFVGNGNEGWLEWMYLVAVIRCSL